MTDAPLVPDAGTPVAPVTPETVASPETFAPEAAAAPESPLSLAEASDAWLKAPAADSPTRGPDGKFVAKEPTPVAGEGDAGASASPDGAAPDAAAATPDADDPAQFIEARRGEEVVKLHKDTLIPVTRKGKTTWEPLEKVQREGMLKVDYDAGKQEQKAREREMRTRETQLALRAEQLAAERADMLAAMSDPQKNEDLMEHLRLMETNPRYKAAFEAKAQRDEWAAEGEAQRVVEQRAVLEDAVEQSLAWIDEAVARYPGIDPERVRQRYSEALQLPPESGRRARFHPDDINAIAAEEHRYVSKAQSPLQAEMQAMKDTLARQAAELAALKKNGITNHALNRARTVPTGPAGGLPPAPGRRAVETPTGARDLGSMGDSWVKGG